MILRDRIPESIASTLRPLLLLMLLPALLVHNIGCTSPPENLNTAKTDLPIRVQDGYEISQFPSAGGQLNFAKSGFTEKKKKKAAYRAVLTLFPEDHLECGHSSIGLAYLHLEPDYRFASPLEISKAANDFKDIIEDFTTLPDVLAKAHWYLGWIYTDLMKTPEKGLVHYWQIALDFPDIPMNMSPPAPWVNLVYPTALILKDQKPSSPQKLWAEAALLEIVRNTRDNSQAIKAFDLLYDRFFSTPATGLALKAMLADPVARPELAAHALPKIEPYLSRNKDNLYLARDIRTLAEGIAR